jgi:hypothetical protein
VSKLIKLIKYLVMLDLCLARAPRDEICVLIVENECVTSTAVSKRP